jgi:CheY-like chemotaxis protein
MKNSTILVIEDNKLNMKLVSGMLSLGDYTMLEAMDAEMGIQMAREYLPDLILMDIQLPGINGLEATKIISNDANLKDIPILALTSYAMEGDKEKALAAGCVGYITKPIDVKKLLETVTSFLKRGEKKTLLDKI